jgi:hypothetical protein
MKTFSGVPAPGVKVTVEMMAGSTSLAKNSQTKDIADPVGGGYMKYEIPLTLPADVSVPPGTKISMVFTYETAGCNCYASSAYPRGTSEDRTWSFTLPLVPAGGGGSGGPSLLYEPLEQPTLSRTFSAATSLVAIHNWTSQMQAGAVTFNSTVQAGNVTVALLDADNETLFEATHSASDTTRAEFDGAAPGAWRLLVAYEGFQGTINVTVAAPQGGGPMPTSTGGSTPTGGTNPTSTQGTGSPSATGGSPSPTGTKAGDNGTPSVAVPLVAAALLAVAFAARRRAR